MTEKESKVPVQVKDAIEGVLALLKSGNLPEAIAKAVFPSDNKPCSAWSFSNRLLVAIDYIYDKYPEVKKLEGKEKGNFIFGKLGSALEEMDYRGFNQWQKVDRKVRSGSTASYILAPLIAKFTKRYYHNEDGKKVILKPEEKAPEGKEEKTESIQFPKGFKGVAVFEIKDTQGKEVKYKKLKLPELPYTAVAEFLDIKVIPKSFANDYYGAYSPSAKTIVLCTPDQTTFFHELAHAVDGYILSFENKKLKTGQQVDQELVAQFSANTIAYIRGYKIEESTAYTKKYIEGYAGKDANEMILKLVARIERIVEFIVNFKQAKSPNREMEEKTDEPKSKTEELADDPSKPYEYVCVDCNKEFKGSSKDNSCPSCKSKHTNARIQKEDVSGYKKKYAEAICNDCGAIIKDTETPNPQGYCTNCMNELKKEQKEHPELPKETIKQIVADHEKISLDDTIKKKFKNYSDVKLLERINSRFKAGKNDDDEIHELQRRSKVKGFKIKANFDTYEIVK